VTIAETITTAEELEERIRAENDQRYTFYRMLRATDRVLWALEELNVAEVDRLPAGLRQRMRDSLAELPVTVLVKWVDSDRVQPVLDATFAVQDALLAAYVPGYEREAGEGEE
jgi:hypothetical protein